MMEMESTLVDWLGQPLVNTVAVANRYRVFADRQHMPVKAAARIAAQNQSPRGITMLDRRPALAALFATVVLAACGGSSDAPAPSPAPTGPDLTQRTAAASTTAQNNSVCSSIRPFYWEIGDGTQRLASGSVNAPGNATTYTASTVMPIASAT
jgi:hypothetical protein